jgi:SAM-dependent methyltransferase
MWRMPRATQPTGAFQVGDACALPFPDATFDHTVSMLALQFVARPEVAVREMRRVTRAGGTVACATWDTRGGFIALRMIFDAAAMLDKTGQQARAAAYTRPLSLPGELERVWREAGLSNVAQDMITIRMDFASFADFWTPNGRPGRAGRGVRRRPRPSDQGKAARRGTTRLPRRRAQRAALLRRHRLGGEGHGAITSFLARTPRSRRCGD